MGRELQLTNSYFDFLDLEMPQHLRIARPVSDLAKTKAMYCAGLGLAVLAAFENHEGFNGVMLGVRGSTYHFEFTCFQAHPLVPTPTSEDLAVFYFEAQNEWRAACSSMLSAGFKQVDSFNPYWDVREALINSARILLE